jgi:uncharacterized protein (TIGR02217 family)
MATNDVGIVAITAAGLTVDGTIVAGVAWSVSRSPTFQTRIQRAVSGRELRAMDYPAPLWQYQLSFNVLRDQWDIRAGNGVGSGYDELRTLYALYMGCYGAFGTFLFSDPSDNQRTGESIGIGDASTSTFQLQAQYGSGPIFIAPVTAVNRLTAIYFNGITQAPSTYNCACGLNSTGLITFNSPPSSGVSITADFTYYFRCRFVDDSYQFDNFMYQLWQLKKLTFISVFP